MKASVLARKIHKWIALLVGVQVLFWMFSGAYMATVNIDFIRGDSLVRNLRQPLPSSTQRLYSIAQIVDRYPQAIATTLVSRNSMLYFVVRGNDQTVLLNAYTGQQVSPISRDQAIALAKHYYTGDAAVNGVELLDDENARPKEIGTRPLPLWQIAFDDKINTTFYLSPSTGELAARRHEFWRLYDFLWMFHIMDYENRTDINNNLLRFAALVGLVMALSGLWLLVHSLRGRRPKNTAAIAGADQSGRSYGPVSETS